MAKIIIPFNDKEYSIDESSFAEARAELKSHLQTVMAGSGEEIVLDGVSYSVDSTKLTTAKNDFISHLGTTSGNGYKVVVSGVEYYIDSDKINNAIAELEIVLGNLHSGESGGEKHDDVIPQGAFYGNLVTSAFYSEMPEVASDGDVYLYGDYFYTYSSALNGWSVYLATEDTGVLNFIPNYPVVNRDQTSYGSILESINNKSIVCLDNTFNNCRSLVAAPNIPTGVNSSNRAFMLCQSLESVIIPEGVTSISEGAFQDCIKLKSIKIPSSVVSIGDTAFVHCDDLEDVTISEGVKHIGNYAFDLCKSLINIVIPDSVINIGENAFFGCGLTNVELSSNLVSIGAAAFSSCRSLEFITFKGTVAQWNTITLGDNWNTNVPATYVQCSDGQVSLA